MIKYAITVHDLHKNDRLYGVRDTINRQQIVCRISKVDAIVLKAMLESLAEKCEKTVKAYRILLLICTFQFWLVIIYAGRAWGFW